VQKYIILANPSNFSLIFIHLSFFSQVFQRKTHSLLIDIDLIIKKHNSKQKASTVSCHIVHPYYQSRWSDAVGW